MIARRVSALKYVSFDHLLLSKIVEDGARRGQIQSVTRSGSYHEGHESLRDGACTEFCVIEQRQGTVPFLLTQVLGSDVKSIAGKRWWLYIFLLLSVALMSCPMFVERMEHGDDGLLCALGALFCWLVGWGLAIAVLRQGGRLGVLIWVWLITGTVAFGTFFLLLFAFVLG